MSALPESWLIAKLADVAKWGSGGTPSRANSNYYGGNIPWVKTGELGKRFILDSEEKITELGLQNSSAKLFSKGSVVIAMYGATIGKTSILGIDATTNQACAIGTPVEGLTTSEYLFHYLSSQKEAFIEAGKGGAQPNISQTVIKDWPIPLAPIDEQKRIADKLDAVLARVDACRDHLDLIPATLKRFRQSVLATATSGKLTEEWRNAQSIDEWRTCTLKDICISITDGDHQAPPQVEAGVPFITISAINDGKLRLEKAVRFVPKTYFDNLKADRRPQVADVLFSVTGSICIPALVNIDAPFTFQRHIAILRPDQAKITSNYLYTVLGSDSIRQQGLKVATGTAQLTIPLTALRSFSLNLPPVEEQHEIVRRVESLFAYADRLEANYNAARAKVEKLTPALLAKAFHGELVPQDTNDEPASELLTRIAATRAIDMPKKSRKPTNHKIVRAPKENATMTKSRQDYDVKNQPYLAGHLKLLGGSAAVEVLFKVSELPVADFYKQLAWEVEQGFVKDSKTVLEAANAA